MGKYSHITSKLPRILGTEAPYQTKVDQVKDHILNAPSIGAHEEDEYYHELESIAHELEAMAARMEQRLIAVSGGRRHGIVLARIYRAVRRLKDTQYEKLESSLNLLHIATEQLVVDQFEVEGTTSMKLAEGGTVRVQEEPHAQVKDRATYHQWCLNEGLGSQMSLPWQTTNAILKERLLSGLDTMPGVEAYSKAKAVYSKK